MAILDVALFAAAFIAARFLVGCSPSIVAVKGSIPATPVACVNYSFAPMPAAPVLPDVSLAANCPRGEVCYSRADFMKLQSGIDALIDDSRMTRKFYADQVSNYGATK